MHAKQRQRREARRAHHQRQPHSRGKRPWPSDRRTVERDQRRAARRQAEGTQPTLTINDELRSLMPSEERIRDHKQADPLWPRSLVKAIAQRTADEREAKQKARSKR